jgi:hypothetical protein
LHDALPFLRRSNSTATDTKMPHDHLNFRSVASVTKPVD